MRSQVGVEALRAVRMPDEDAPTVVIAVPSSGPASSSQEPASPAQVAPAASVRRPSRAIGAALAVVLLGAIGMAVVALDPGTRVSAGPSDVPAAVPDLASSTPAPVASATPGPTDAAPAEAGGKGDGKGNGKGKGHGKDKP